MISKQTLYMREYRVKNKEKINVRRKERRLERILLGEDVNKISRYSKEKYYKENKENINIRAKNRNWNYNSEKARMTREKYNNNHPIRNVLNSRKSRAIKEGLVFELTEEWYNEEWVKGCAVTGLKFDPSGYGTPWVAHIDRIIPKLGYTKRNSRLVCACYNLAKKHWNDEDVLKMAKNLLRESDA